MAKPIDISTKRTLMNFQRNEITEYFIYRKLADFAKGKNKGILQRISKDELRHYNIWKSYTKTDVSPDRFKILKYFLYSKLFGLTFATKLMESGEILAQRLYQKLARKVPEAETVFREENGHEKNLLKTVDEEKLNYMGSMVLGLNDALVELTGTLAGLTLALQNSGLIAMVGLITGIAAALSMASSEYLSQKSEGGKNPFRASIYTGIAYILAVTVLVLPFFIFGLYYLAMASTLFSAIAIIFAFTYFVSVTKGLEFKRRFFEMAAISLGVAAISFAIGFVVKLVLGVNV